MDPAFMDRLITLAREMPFSTLKSICGRFASLPQTATLEDCLKIVSQYSEGKAHNSLGALVGQAIETGLDVSPSSLAFALESAGAMDEHWRKSATYELVWTGPSPKGSVFRRMDQALFDIIHEAEEEILLVTFVAYKAPELVSGLTKALERNVKISMIIETDTVGGMGSFQHMQQTFGDRLAKEISLYRWPNEKRTKDSNGKSGSLHVKCAISDQKRLLLSSANLTGHAFNLNMEMGVLIRNAGLAAQAHSHFMNLINGGVLASLEHMD